MKKFCIGFIVTGIVLSLAGFITVGACASAGYYPTNFDFNNDTFRDIATEEGFEESIESIVTERKGEDFAHNYSTADAEALKSVFIGVTTADVILNIGNGFTISAEGIDMSLYSEEFKDGELKLEYARNAGLNLGDFDDDACIYITLPQKTYDNFAVEMTTSDVSLYDVNADTFSANSTTGDLHIGRMNVIGDASFHLTTGKLTVFDSSVNNLKIVNTTGEVDFDNSTINGNTVLTETTGEIDMDLIGSVEDYTFSVNKTAGEVEINGKEQVPDTNGSKVMDITVTVGDCSIEFNENDD